MELDWNRRASSSTFSIAVHATFWLLDSEEITDCPLITKTTGSRGQHFFFFFIVSDIVILGLIRDGPSKLL